MSNANAKLAAALKPGQIVKMTGAEAGMGNVKSFMESQKANLAAVLPKHVDADRMLKLALGAMRTTPKLLNCNVESLMGAVVTCSTLGLEPNTPLGHAYLIPFENRQKGTTDVQIVFGYKGLIDLARRSGQIISIAAHEVCQNDEFHFSYGLDEKLIHKPALTGRGEPIAFYAVAKLVGGGYAFEVMGRDQIEEIRDASQNYKFAREKGKTVWGQHFVEMGRKTVLRRLFKYLPVSIELATAANIDSNTEAGKAGNYEEALKGEYSVMPDDAPAALPDNVDGDTGEWTPPASSNWQPSEAELAEIKQREMAEAGDLLGDVPQ
jgi:recombination protein RecT